MKNKLKQFLFYGALTAGLFACQKDDFENIMPENDILIDKKTIVFDDSQIENISNIQENKIFFKTQPKYKKGDLIIGGISKKTPEGLLRKVSEVNENCIITTNATLEEIIKKGNISFKKKFHYEDLENIQKSSKVGFEFQKNFEKIIIDLDSDSSTTNDQLKLVGNIYFNLEQKINLHFDHGVKNASFLFEIYGESGINLVGEINSDFYGKEKITELIFKPFPILTTPIPIIARPHIDFFIEYGGSLDGKLLMSSIGNIDFQVGAIYEKNQGWNFEINNSQDVFLSDLNPVFNCDAKVSSGVRATFNLNEIIGPFVEIKPYLRLDAKTNENPSWKIYSGIDTNIGANFGVLSSFIPEVNKNFTGKEILIKQSDSIETLRAIIYGNPKKGNSPLTVKFDATSSYGGNIEKYLFTTNNEKFENTSGILNYTYFKPGNYSAKLEIFDDLGRIEKDSLEIIVNSPFGEFIDPRDSQKYQTIEIYDQIWFAENLRINDFDSYNPNGESSSFFSYGKLYKMTKEYCPDGWHTPSSAEWENLINNLGGFEFSGSKLKESGNINWNHPNSDATNESFFTALPAGGKPFSGIPYGAGDFASFWSSTNTDGKNYIYYRLRKDSGNVQKSSGDQSRAYSIRCIKD